MPLLDWAQLRYQWQRGNTNVTGATNSIYAFAAALADNGAKFRCQITYPGGRVASLRREPDTKFAMIRLLATAESLW